jgi:hypothetical protein
MTGQFKRTLTGFECFDENSKKIAKRFKFGEIAELDNTQRRNPKFHAKFFAILNLTFQNQDITQDFATFREVVTIHAGYFTWVKLLDGMEMKRAKSISFEKMDDLEFEGLYNEVFNICLSILGCKSEELELELLRFE